MTNEKRKFKRTKTQGDPTNPSIDQRRKKGDFDLNNETIIEKKKDS